MRRFPGVFLLLFLILFQTDILVSAQNSDESASIITVENVAQLQSVTHINFADLEGEFAIGWFAMSDHADRFLVVDRNQNVIILDAEGNISNAYSLHEDQLDTSISIIDAMFYDSDFYVLSAIDGNTVVGDQILNIEGTPVSIIRGADNGFVWIETLSLSGETVFIEFEIESLTGSLYQQTDVIPYAPAQDLTAVVRIGRIPPPYVVTSSLDGVVKLWNIHTGDVLAEAQIDEGPAVFGNINADATHLAWRNPESEALHVLNFETGEDRIVTELSGAYAQYFFLAKDADVILAVNLDLIPHVFAWDVESGERYDLGVYRECNRIPDMVRLSQDGSTLVIGCDTGLDIWQVVD